MTQEQWAKRIAANLVRGGFRGYFGPQDRSDLDSFMIDMINDAIARDRHAAANKQMAAELEGGAT